MTCAHEIWQFAMQKRNFFFTSSYIPTHVRIYKAFICYFFIWNIFGLRHIVACDKAVYATVGQVSSAAMQGIDIRHSFRAMQLHYLFHCKFCYAFINSTAVLRKFGNRMHVRIWRERYLMKKKSIRNYPKCLLLDCDTLTPLRHLTEIEIYYPRLSVLIRIIRTLKNWVKLHSK